MSTTFTLTTARRCAWSEVGADRQRRQQMSELVTDVIIDAPASRVWKILTEGATYGDWNPAIRSVSGTIDLHETLTVTRVTAGGDEHKTHPTVAFFSSDREMRWHERTVLPGILDTEECFKLERLGPDRVRFVHWQATTGILALGHGSGADDKERQLLESMNQGLKEQAEHAPNRSEDDADASAPGSDRSRQTART
jgi:hypothetical protein